MFDLRMLRDLVLHLEVRRGVAPPGRLDPLVDRGHRGERLLGVEALQVAAGAAGELGPFDVAVVEDLKGRRRKRSL